MVNSRWLPGGRRRAMARLAAAAATAALLCGAPEAAAAAPGRGSAAQARAGQPAAASRVRLGDHPAGFWYGTDSSPMTVTGSPYREPVIGGNYGGYIGMTGKWSTWLGCHVSRLAWSSANSQEANANFADHLGIGTGVYWFMGGPGVDPHYGWNSVYTAPCSGRVRIDHVPAAVDRADFNGFAAYLTSHSSYKVGAYSAAPVWNSIFGTGVDSLIPNTYEWTYTPDTSSLSHPPDGWCLEGTTTCAHFFGGQSRGGPYALMWQWSGGGGTFNGHGDFDQIDANLTP